MHQRLHISSSHNILAIFDFDGTLTYGDSLIPFLKFVRGKPFFLQGIITTSPALIKYALKLIPNWQAKEKLLSYFLSGQTPDQLQPIIERFIQDRIARMLRPEAMHQLHWHQTQGHTTILVSASPELYLKPWAISAGFTHVLGTQLEVHNGILTGRIRGKNCYGAQKVARLRQLIPQLEAHFTYVYGDSRGDKELLDIASSPHYKSFPKHDN